MSVLTGRRDFIASLFAAGMLPAISGCGLLPRSRDDEYSVLVLGDVHFDAPEIGVYHSHYKPEKGRSAEIFPLRMKREHDMWSGLMQRLADAARRDVRPDTKFVLQLGDLIQGNCAKASVHAKMLEDGFSYFKNSVAPDLPFVPVVGNHVTSFADLGAPEGRLAQFMATSVWSDERQAAAKTDHASPKDYARFPKKAKDYDLADAKALFGEYSPYVKGFFSSGLQGRYMLNVSDRAVTMTAYGGDGTEPVRTFVLRCMDGKET
jgi:hypothetical protein